MTGFKIVLIKYSLFSISLQATYQKLQPSWIAVYCPKLTAGNIKSKISAFIISNVVNFNSFNERMIKSKKMINQRNCIDEEPIFHNYHFQLKMLAAVIKNNQQTTKKHYLLNKIIFLLFLSILFSVS